jgi:hypothetical protein
MTGEREASASRSVSFKYMQGTYVPRSHKKNRRRDVLDGDCC